MHKVYCSIAPISSISLVGAEHLLLQLQESEGASQEVCRVITREREAWAMRKNIVKVPSSRQSLSCDLDNTSIARAQC